MSLDGSSDASPTHINEAIRVLNGLGVLSKAATTEGRALWRAGGDLRAVMNPKFMLNKPWNSAEAVAIKLIRTLKQRKKTQFPKLVEVALENHPEPSKFKRNKVLLTVQVLQCLGLVRYGRDGGEVEWLGPSGSPSKIRKSTGVHVRRLPGPVHDLNNARIFQKYASNRPSDAPETSHVRPTSPPTFRTRQTEFLSPLVLGNLILPASAVLGNP